MVTQRCRTHVANGKKIVWKEMTFYEQAHNLNLTHHLSDDPNFGSVLLH